MQYVSLFLLLVYFCMFLSFMCSISGKAMSNFSVSECNDNEDNSDCEFWTLFSGQALHTAALTCILYGRGKWSNRFSSRHPSTISTATNSWVYWPSRTERMLLYLYETLCVYFPIIDFSLFTLKYSCCEPTREDCSLRQLHLHQEVLCYK